ncbi:MAG: dockerin type I domain-containing protein, partial [Candidatus Poribacteria bacterium]|nr:dockerin type I domain-containing protein [Candidatus Poribacteria bacterium]
PHINGGFMETGVPYDKTGATLEQRLNVVEDSLLWLDRNLREPRINGLEGWVIPTEPPDSPTNRRWMRAITTLSLTHSDGYVVFTSANDGYHHYWYNFWDADLGQPVGLTAQFYEEIPGLYIREYTNGWAVYNHSGETQEITLPEVVTGVSSELEGMTHTLFNLDGEMYLKASPANPADVNGDGVVNILDLMLVAQGFGADKKGIDVNGDGVVNVFDLVFVADQF